MKYIFSLQSPTLNEFFVYKLLQALSQKSYENKCITVPSTGKVHLLFVLKIFLKFLPIKSLGKTARVSPESVDMIMNYSSEIIIDDCIDTLDNTKNESHKFFPANIDTFAVLMIHQCFY